MSQAAKQPFWRATPLTKAEAKLLALVRAAHIASCDRPNASREAFLLAMQQSGSYVQGLIGALHLLWLS